MAQRMVTEFGMSEALGTIAFRKKESEVFLGRDMMTHQREYSEKTAELIDSEVKRITVECGVKAKKLLQDNFAILTKMAEALIQKEVLEAEEVDDIMGIPRVRKDPPSPTSAPQAQTQTPAARPFIDPSASGGPIPQPAG